MVTDLTDWYYRELEALMDALEEGYPYGSTKLSTTEQYQRYREMRPEDWREFILSLEQRFRGFPDSRDRVQSAIDTYVARMEALGQKGRSAAAARRGLKPLPEGPNREVYAPKVRAAARRYGIPEHVLVAMIATESKFNPEAINAVSGALGIAQFMPDTARELGVDPFDPEAAIDASARYLRQLIDMFDDDLRAGVAAYNFGPGNIINLRAAYVFHRDNWYDKIPEETQKYLKSVLGAWGP